MFRGHGWTPRERLRPKSAFAHLLRRPADLISLPEPQLLIDADRLTEPGVDAVYLEGGFAAWEEGGNSVVAIGAEP